MYIGARGAKFGFFKNAAEEKTQRDKTDTQKGYAHLVVCAGGLLVWGIINLFLGFPRNFFRRLFAIAFLPNCGKYVSVDRTGGHS
jgi:hypothetical protein